MTVILRKVQNFSTHISPAGPAPPRGRPHISWRGWSRNTPHRADPQLVHTPHVPHPDTSSVCWLMRRNRESPNHWWGKPEIPADRNFIYTQRATLHNVLRHHKRSQPPSEMGTIGWYFTGPLWSCRVYIGWNIYCNSQIWNLNLKGNVNKNVKTGHCSVHTNCDVRELMLSCLSSTPGFIPGTTMLQTNSILSRRVHLCCHCYMQSYVHILWQRVDEECRGPQPKLGASLELTCEIMCFFHTRETQRDGECVQGHPL